MGGDVGNLIFLVVVGLAVAISAIVKSYRESKAREERMRRLHQQPGQDPIASSPKPAAPSPLLQFRQFMEQLKAQSGQGQARSGEGQAQSGRGQMKAPPPFQPQHPVRHAGLGARPPQALPVKPGEQAAARPGRGMLTEHLDEKEAKAPVVTQAPPPAVSPLAGVIGSQRSDFERAVLLSEILGKPVTLRRPVPPRLKS
jgi:hypothetical protein